MFEKLKKRLLETQQPNTDEKIASFSSLIKASPDVREHRINICKQCEYFFPVTSTCTKCGCFMIVKTWLKTSKCPIDKWSKEK